MGGADGAGRRRTGRRARGSESVRALRAGSGRRPAAGTRRARRAAAALPAARASHGWLRSTNDRLGGVLADDMGLGKTLQALALICHVQRGRGPPATPVPGGRPDQRGVATGRRRRRGSPRPLRVVTVDRDRRGAAQELARRPSPAPTSSSPPTRCSGWTTTAYAAHRRGPGWSWTRRSSSRTTSPRPTSARAGCPRRSSSRSPARRWRTT